ncbi:hypothetical protein FYM89_01485 [Lactobacillus salivarius]|uniref:hypothetical protein n=1 Tax=Ligilactobacillus salivarius TaxID=1624 RepID=UPI001370947A|nr:hypothetical protein [Ligilactobacillus salivarius]MYU96052.1 hypothetical protein [Ligilactobacillus salivarius]
MNDKEKLDAAIFLLKSAREQLKLPYYKFNTTRYVDEIREALKMKSKLNVGDVVKKGMLLKVI